METDEAIKVVEAYRAQHDLFGTLEAMIAMQTDDVMTAKQNAAYHLLFYGMRQLFYGDEA